MSTFVAARSTLAESVVDDSRAIPTQALCSPHALSRNRSSDSDRCYVRRCDGWIRLGWSSVHYLHLAFHLLHRSSNLSEYCSSVEAVSSIEQSGALRRRTELLGGSQRKRKLCQWSELKRLTIAYFSTISFLLCSLVVKVSLFELTVMRRDDTDISPKTQRTTIIITSVNFLTLLSRSETDGFSPQAFPVITTPKLKALTATDLVL